MNGFRTLLAGVGARARAYRPPPWLVAALPGSSKQFGPPRRIASAWDVPGLARAIGPAPEVRFADPQFLNSVDPYWRSPYQVLASVRPFVIERQHARLLAPGAWVTVDPDTLLHDTAFWGHRTLREAQKWHQVFLRKKPRPSRRLTGRVLSLASDFAPNSYGHWLIDSLPRWLFVERAGLAAGDFDSIYLPGPDTPSTRRLLTALGLPPEKIVRTPPVDDLEVEQLTATSFPGASGSASSLARAMAVRLQPPRAPRRRLYLARDGHRRNFTDTRALQAVLTAFGFETCFPATDPDTIAKCAEASIIFGIEGSQCFNALFAPVGGALVVVAPDGFHPLPYMQTIAGAASLSLFVIGARSLSADGSCELPPAELRQCLEKIVALHP